MKAEIRPRITTEGRTRLETVIPLSTPYLVFLDPCDACNAHCSWCPTGIGETRKYRKQQMMKWDVFRKAIDDLASMPEKIKTLRLYMMGEPLLNPRFPEMVRYAKSTGRFGQVDTTTNAILLTEKLAEELVYAGLDKIFISIPIDYDDYFLRRIYYLYHIAHKQPRIHVKIIGDTLTEEEKQRFLNDMEGICDSCSIEHLSNCWPAFDAGSTNGTVGIYQQPIEKEVKTCPYVLYSAAINSDGTVSACFLDYRHQMIVGDLKTDNFRDIWNGQMLRDYQIMHLKGLRYSHPMCGYCGQLRIGAPDDVDAYAKILLDKVTHR